MLFLCTYVSIQYNRVYPIFGEKQPLYSCHSPKLFWCKWIMFCVVSLWNMNRKLAKMMVSWFPSPPTYTYKRKTKTTVNWKLGNKILHYCSENDGDRLASEDVSMLWKGHNMGYMRTGFSKAGYRILLYRNNFFLKW